MITKQDLELAVTGIKHQVWGAAVTVILALGVLQHFFK
jgi:hypothetical protein